MKKILALTLVFLALTAFCGISFSMELEPKHDETGASGHGRGHDDGNLKKLAVDSKGNIYLVTKEDESDDNSSYILKVISNAGAETTFNFSEHLSHPLVSNDDSLMVVTAYDKEADSSTVYIFTTPMTSASTGINVSVTGKVTALTIENGQIFLTSVYRDDADKIDYLYIIESDGTTSLLMTI